MSTAFNIRNLKLPHVSKMAVVIGSLLIVLGLVAGVAGWQLYKRLTNNTAVAYFEQALALYPGDKVQIMGVRVGAIDKIEPAGDKMRVTFHYNNKYKVPADVTASILNPSLVASRTIQLSPAYTGGDVLQNNAVIPFEKTQVPVEWDDLRNQITDIVGQLGPTPEQPKGPFGDVIESFADGLDGKGKQLNTTLTALSDAITALNEGRGDFFAVTKSLALFVNALHRSDQQFVALNDNLAEFTGKFNQSDQQLADTLKQIDSLLTTARSFIDENGEVLAHDVNNLAEATTALLQPEPRDGLETALHVFPNLAANLVSIYEPNSGSLSAVPVVASFANPMQFICSSIQAGSRLGYQESAELCAQYLAPILDAIKFNFPPFGVNQVSTAVTLPKSVAYSEERLRPPPGYKDTTVPGIFSRDTLFSHGNHEPGWIVAPGMQGVQVQQFTKNMLTPDSLAALMGGPDPSSIPPAGPRGGAPPNAYDQNNPLPPPWYPQPGPQPGPAPEVVPGPLPVSQQLPGTNPAQQNPGPGAGPAPAPAPAGPALPAEVGGQ
ncbi:virulence factor Mce family protein [Mycolicibacterium confluentis]|uniref:Mammalian cell entry protein n=1 Tax=Mycolicibacterium confluentis TaxID=28047 RepID=A0A7I7Y4B6_9MYCO|nr:virulence factor Mce family protein [Mycolicibacterium confluentis]MCV7322950.1 virulence factor Mce family protein [Mycolicibacterium confluentis]ORV20707.1 mammalian cell entry protein [Mycolicibacterium confluentis]BBZ35953.1 mammalian cell entry protein [Mycolicibacterium confluentis]